MSTSTKQLINRTIISMKKGHSDENTKLFDELVAIDSSVLFPELYRQVKEYAQKVDLENLKPIDLMLNTDFAVKVVRAVQLNDLESLSPFVGWHDLDRITALLCTIASLKASVRRKRVSSSNTAIESSI